MEQEKENNFASPSGDDDDLSDSEDEVEDDVHETNSDSSSSHADERADQLTGLNSHLGRHRRTNSAPLASNIIDIEKGAIADRVARRAVLRSESSMHPTRVGTRRRRKIEKSLNNSLNNFLGLGKHGERTGAGAGTRDDRGSSTETPMSTLPHDKDSRPPPHRQYRLSATRRRTKMTRLLDYLGYNDLPATMYEEAHGVESCSCGFVRPENAIRKFFFWAFRSSFSAVFVASIAGFFILTNIFAIGIYSIWHRHPTCVGGSEINPGWYIDAFELSWTTFTTVGYGAIFAGISRDEPNIIICTGMTMLMALESFVGILFASMFAAIMLVKVSRTRSYAHVDFSGPMVVRYGQSLVEGPKVEGLNEPPEMINIPCPVVEIRILNSLHSVPGGELVDCTVNVVASIDEAQAFHMLKRKGGRRPRGLLGNQRPSRWLPAMGSQQTVFDVDPDLAVSEEDKLNLLELMEKSARLDRENASNVFEEDHSGYLVHKRIFSNMELESRDHPFFNKTWVIRHVLNDTSPLLNSYARVLVKRNSGYWPKELNNHHGVRAAISFDQIVVNLSATSNAGGNSVYALKIYDRSDMFVGYQHVSMIYKTSNGVAVDNTLLNDIVEQPKGGAEPLDTEKDDRTIGNLMMIL